MSHSPLTKQSQRVNFKYTSSPPRWQEPQYNLKASPSIQGSSLSIPLFPTLSINPLCSTTHTSTAAINQPTLKKEGQQSNNTTLRKQFVNQNVLETSLQEDKSINGGHKNSIFERINEQKVLRQEIRFMRHLVDMAQNAEKQLRLQFQLYKAAQDSYHREQQSKQEKMVLQIQQLKRTIQHYKESQQQLLKENNKLHTQLKQQTNSNTYFQNILKQKQHQNDDLRRNSQAMFEEIQLRAADLSTIAQQLANYRQSYEQIRQINDSLRLQMETTSSKLQKAQNKLAQISGNYHNRISNLQDLLNFKDEEYLNLTTQINTKDEQINILTKYYEQIILELKHQKQQSTLKKSQPASQSNIQSASLSQQEVNHHLFFLKNQHENIQTQDYLALKQQNEVLRQELELSKFTFQQNLQQLKEQYEEDIERGKQNERQLAIYAKQIDILVEELERIKVKKYHYTPTVVIQEQIQQEVQNEGYQDEESIEDNNKIKNDLRMYSQDCFSYPQNHPQAHNQSMQFNLNDILESQTMITNYVIDNRRKNRLSPQ